MWLTLASSQFHCVHSSAPIINYLIINSLFPNDHLSCIIHLNTALKSPFISSAVNRWQKKCAGVKRVVVWKAQRPGEGRGHAGLMESSPAFLKKIQFE